LTVVLLFTLQVPQSPVHRLYVLYPQILAHRVHDTIGAH
jgi:hypothetical protein